MFDGIRERAMSGLQEANDKISESKIVRSGQSIAGATKLGFNATSGRGLATGTAGAGAMLTLGGVGATIGASAGGFAAGSSGAVIGGIAGGITGTAALPLAGATVGAIGSAGVGLAKMAPKALSVVGSAAINSAPFVGATGLRAVDEAASHVWGVGKRLINWEEGADSISKVKLSKFGHALLGATAVAEGVKGAVHSIQKAHMGRVVGSVSSTPQASDYMRKQMPISNNMPDHAGATGDLVFALNANRNG